MKSAVVAVYSHVEYYPPTINAIELLSTQFDEVHIIQRNTKKSSRFIQQNVKEHNNGSFVAIADSQNKSYWWKLKSFISFTFSLYKVIKENKLELILIYDPIPLLAFRLVRLISNSKSKVWYHNHDILLPKNVTFLSISWFAMHSEKSYIKKVDVFTLPTELRKSYFNINPDSIKLLPNYPSKQLINNINAKKELAEDNSKLKIIYQGVIKNEHGIEEIIRCASVFKDIELSIVGISDESYIENLNSLILENKVTGQVKIFPFFDNYFQLLRFTMQHDIGLGFYKPTNEMNTSMGTASNKIFEYLACGLLVFLNDNEFYRLLFQNYKCIFYSELDEMSILNAIKNALEFKNELKQNAKLAFENDFYFEKHFNPILQNILNDIH